MNHNSNGLVGQAGHFGALQEQQLAAALQQQHHNLLKQQVAPGGAKGSAQDTPLQAIQQQQQMHQHGACDAGAGKPSHAAGTRDQTSAQHGGTADPKGPAPQHQQKVPSSTLVAGSAVTGALVNALPPAVTGQHTQLQHPSVASLTAVKQEPPGSPSAAHSPTSTAPPAGNASPTPEVPAHAAAAAAGGSGGRFQLPAPSPLPPPDASEGPDAVAEYKRYLERWGEGTTLAQRWHRLAEKGVLGDIVDEWEEWQNDMLLQGLQAQNKTAGRATRKHRRDEGPEVDLDAPRQTRTRRVPQALQDYQVEAVTGTPEPPAILGGGSSAAAAGAAAVTGARATGVPARASAQQQQHGADAYPAGGDGISAGAAGHTGRAARAAAAAAPQAARLGRGPSAAAAAAAPAPAPRAQLAPANKVPGPQQQYAQQQHGAQQQLYSQQQQQRPVGTNGYLLNGYQGEAQQQQQQQARANGYADASRGYDSHSHMLHANSQAAAAAAGHGGWLMQQAQQQQQMGGAGMYHQQQQNGYHHPGVSMPPAAASHELMMAQLLQMGSMANNNSSSTAAAAAPAAAAALPFDQAMSAAAAAMPPGVQFEAAFAAFEKILARGNNPVLGQVDPVAFTQHFAAALQQQQQQQQRQ